MNPIPLYSQNEIEPNDVCSICLDSFNNDIQNHTLIECNHTFHSTCLIGWLRVKSGCPLCRGVSNYDQYHRSNGVVFRHILSFCKSKKNNSKKLKRMYKTYEKSRDSHEEHKKILKKFKDENKDVFKMYYKLIRNRCRASSKFRRIRNEISNLPIRPINI